MLRGPESGRAPHPLLSRRPRVSGRGDRGPVVRPGRHLLQSSCERRELVHPPPRRERRRVELGVVPGGVSAHRGTRALYTLLIPSLRLLDRKSAILARGVSSAAIRPRVPLLTWTSLCQLFVFLRLLLAITKPLRSYMASVFDGKRTFLSKPLLPLERLIYRLSGVDPEKEQTWRTYTGCCLACGLANFLLFYVLLRCERYLPGHPAGGTTLTPDLAFNSAVSFLSNTSWQRYCAHTRSTDLQYLG